MRKRYLPGLECLEARTVPAVSIGLTPGDPGRLEITGDSAVNYITVYQNDALDQLLVRETAGKSIVQELEFDSSAIDRVVVRMNGGGDHFSYYCQGDFTETKTIRVDMGGGNDQPLLSIDGTIEADLTYRLGTSFADANNNGNEYALVYLGAVDHANVLVEADLGDGNDTLHAEFIGNELVSANVTFDVLGGTGGDDLRVHAMEGAGFSAVDLDIDATSQLDVTLDGQVGNDDLDVYYQGMMRGQLTLNLHGRSGNDHVNAHLSMIGEPEPGPVVSDGTLDANLRGQGGSDSMGLELLNAGLLDFALAEAPFLHGGANIDSATADTTENVTLINIEVLPPVFGFEL